MSFGSDMAAGFAARIALAFVVVFILGGIVALGGWFGIAWVYDHVRILVH